MSRPLPPRPFLYAIVDVEALGTRSVGEAVAALVSGGARLVQLRAKRLSDRRFVELGREALLAARAADALLLVNDRPDVARVLGADGVHVGQEDLAPEDVRALLPEAVVGLSTHSLDQIDAAAEAPVDYLAVGPVFATSTKQRPDPVVGVELLRLARARTARPLVAIGGISVASVRRVVEAGADGVAVISALLAQEDLAAAARELIAALGA